MKTTFRIFRYLLNYKKEVLLNVSFNLLYVFFSLFSFVMIIPFVSVLFGILQAPATCPDFALSKDVIIDFIAYHLNYYKQTQGVVTCLLYISCAYLVFAFFAALCRYLGMYFLSPIRNGVVGDLRNDIYHKITILPLSFFSSQRKGDLISRMTSDLADIEWSVLSCLQMLVKDPFMVIVFLVALLIASAKLVLFVLITLPIAMFLISKVGSSLKRNSIKGQQQMGMLTSKTEEALGAMRTIKSYNAESVLMDKYNEQNNFFTHIMTKVYRRKELAAPITEIFSILTLIIIVLFGGMMVIKGEINPSILIGFTVLFARIVAPLQSITTAYYNLQKAEAAAKRIYSILDAQEVVMEKEDAIIMPKLCDKIIFDNVSFSYDDNNVVLQDINLVVSKGETVAIVGHSGAGKTTLIDLLPRFADPTQGKITIDGLNIKEFNINSLRTSIGLVTQESTLFNDSVFGNIAFGNEKATMTDVQTAATIANAHEFICKLDRGYYTNIGDRGLNLSGGQRQRICIARAVLNNPDILLLDEATSALDTESEYLVRESLNRAMQGRTTFIIAHRLSTVMYADRIIVLDGGKIVEQGNHKQLMNDSIIYASLVKLQML
ncbi:MAG: ABC transporter ATP-binding protein/permease [Bacteroidales bacterium]|jgi:subfamily B ATP-binding cassette protein MsbA|nr:ABC transporter ATP-binding protein/permease [Bacteroidales bacterium]